MDNKTRVFFPLRSNVNWFCSADLKNEMACRVKQAILVYDEICVEDGLFEADILDKGASELYFPPGMIPQDRRIIRHEKDLAQTTITLSLGQTGDAFRTPVLHGKTVERFKVDYYEIFKDVDISQCDFLKFIVIGNDFPEMAKNEMKRQSFLDKQVFSNIHPNTFYRSFVIDNLNRDLIVSMLFNSAIVLDSKHAEILLKKCMGYELVKEESALRHLLSVSVPNFSELSIERVIELRNDSAWRDLRTFIREIVCTIKSDPLSLMNAEMSAKIVRDAVDKALFAELAKRHKTGKSLSVDLGMGLVSAIPTYGLIATVAGCVGATAQYLKDKSGWLAFLMKLQEN